MGINYFIFNGESSLDYGVYIGGQGTYNAPQRDVKKVSIPGRNGDLIMDNGRYLNTQVAYNIVVMDEFKDKTDAIRAWLSQPTTYVRLEDTYHPEEYRMAMLTGGIEFETSAFNRTGKATVTFDCKPERFLKTGERSETFYKASGVSYINNPTRFYSKPLIRVVGASLSSSNGSVTIGNQIITLTGIDGYVDIDCALMDCFKGTQNANSQVTLGTAGFPALPPGKTGISMSGNILNVEITGRWWTI